MIHEDSSDHLSMLDITDLPPNQQDRVIRFASELAKSLRQIHLAAEQQQKQENIQKNIQKSNRKVKTDERK